MKVYWKLALIVVFLYELDRIAILLEKILAAIIRQ